MGKLKAYIRRHRILLVGLCALVLAIVLATALYHAVGHTLIKAMYDDESLPFLNRLIEDRADRPLEKYVEYGDALFAKFRNILLIILFFFGIFFLYTVAASMKSRKPRFIVVQVIGVVVALVCIDLFLWYVMPVKIGEITFENYRASSNPKIILEPRPLAGEFNSDGIRDYEYSRAKPDGVYRILVIGDSLAYGFRVGLEDTYAKRLEKLLNARAGEGEKYEVINMGVPGYRTTQIVERLKEKGLKYDPDMIIYGHWFDDITYSGFTPFALSPASVSVSERINAMMSGSDFERMAKKILLRSQLVRRIIVLLRERERRARYAGGKDDTLFPLEERMKDVHQDLGALYEDYLLRCREGRYRDLPGFEQYYESFTRHDDFLLWNDGIKELSEVCREGDIQCLLLVTPVIYDYEGGKYHWEELHGFIKAVAGHYSIPAVDLQEEFGRYRAPRLRAGDMEHPSELGHELIAKKLYDWIVRNKGA